jgi:hypothetical protein
VIEGKGRTVADVALVDLAVSLEDAERVGACVGDDRGGKANERLPLWKEAVAVRPSVSMRDPAVLRTERTYEQAGDERVRRRQVLLEHVVGGELQRRSTLVT